MTKKTAVSLQGWGASCQNTSNRGQWSFEGHSHIDCSEIDCHFLSIENTYKSIQFVAFMHFDKLHKHEFTKQNIALVSVRKMYHNK